MSDQALRGAAGIGRGDHACVVCDSDEERWAATSEFLGAAIGRGERVLYVARSGGEREAEDRLAELRGREPIVVCAATAMGYADGGGFDPVEREAAWRTQVHAAIDDGFSGLSVTGDMAWLGELDLALEQILDYERRCSGVVRELPAAALCVYDQRHFDDRTLAHAGHAHPICRGTGVSPAGVFVSRTMEIAAAGPGALRLAGEVDVSNVPSLSSALRTTAEGRVAMLLDVAGLEFIDVAGMRAIQRTARVLAARGGELTVVAPRPLVQRMATLLGMDGLVRTEPID